jgi:hypothetical protein
VHVRHEHEIDAVERRLTRLDPFAIRRRVETATGGESRAVTRLDTASGEVQHSQPEFLPDGRHFLYFCFGSVAGGALDPKGFFVGSLDPSEPARLLLAGVRQARYASGRLLFVRNGTLMSQPFDPDRLTLSGSAQPMIESLTTTSTGATGPTGAYSVSANGAGVSGRALDTVAATGARPERPRAGAPRLAR